MPASTPSDARVHVHRLHVANLRAWFLLSPFVDISEGERRGGEKKGRMSAKPARQCIRGSVEGDGIDGEESLVLRIDCPGCAHRPHANGRRTEEGAEACLICDPEEDGFIEVVLAPIERKMLERASLGLPVDAGLSRRLLKIALLDAIGACILPTERGRAAIAAGWRAVQS
jgi:hypothetical protein